MISSKQDLLNFYFQTKNSIRMNQKIRSARKELALLILEQILSLDLSRIEPSSSVLITICPDRVETFRLDLSNPDDFSVKSKLSDIIIVLGYFQIRDNHLVPGSGLNFYFESPSDGYLFGSTDPLTIITNTYTKKIA